MSAYAFIGKSQPTASLVCVRARRCWCCRGCRQRRTYEFIIAVVSSESHIKSFYSFRRVMCILASNDCAIVLRRVDECQVNRRARDRERKRTREKAPKASNKSSLL